MTKMINDQPYAEMTTRPADYKRGTEMGVTSTVAMTVNEYLPGITPRIAVGNNMAVRMSVEKNMRNKGNVRLVIDLPIRYDNFQKEGHTMHLALFAPETSDDP